MGTFSHLKPDFVEELKPSFDAVGNSKMMYRHGASEKQETSLKNINGAFIRGTSARFLNRFEQSRFPFHKSVIHLQC
jgi:hypothetical protein